MKLQQSRPDSLISCAPSNALRGGTAFRPMIVVFTQFAGAPRLDHGASVLRAPPESVAPSTAKVGPANGWE